MNCNCEEYYESIPKNVCPHCSKFKRVHFGYMDHDYLYGYYYVPLKIVKLVKRKGKFGEFFGCENFPHCKFTLSIKKKRTTLIPDDPYWY